MQQTHVQLTDIPRISQCELISVLFIEIRRPNSMFEVKAFALHGTPVIVWSHANQLTVLFRNSKDRTFTFLSFLGTLHSYIVHTRLNIVKPVFSTNLFDKHTETWH